MSDFYVDVRDMPDRSDRAWPTKARVVRGAAQPTWTKDEVIAAARLFYEMRGFPPTSMDWDADHHVPANEHTRSDYPERCEFIRQHREAFPRSGVVRRLYGSWGAFVDAYVEAGVPRPVRRKHPGMPPGKTKHLRRSPAAHLARLRAIYDDAERGASVAESMEKFGLSGSRINVLRKEARERFADS